MTTNLELSKELYDRGVRIDSLFIHAYIRLWNSPATEGQWEVAINNDIWRQHVTERGFRIVQQYPAPLLHELLEVISKNFTFELGYDGNYYYCDIFHKPKTRQCLMSWHDKENLANCVAGCIVELTKTRGYKVIDGEVVVDGKE